MAAYITADSILASEGESLTKDRRCDLWEYVDCYDMDRWK